MPIELDLEKLKKQYKPASKESALDPGKVKALIQIMYNNDAVYPEADNIAGYDDEKVKQQVNSLCDYLIDIGMPNAAGLKNKFRYKPNDKDSARRLANIKETMEYMVYAINTSDTPAEELGAKFADRALECDDGTLTNLQAMVGELSLEGQGVDAYISEQKDAMVTAFIQEMYNEGKFPDIPLRRRNIVYEVHNISSLKNLVADDFGVPKKSREEDHYLMDNMDLSAKSQIATQIKDKFKQPEVINAFTGGITSKIVENLPTFVENKYPGRPAKFGEDVDESLEALKLSGILSQVSLLTIEGFAITGYKDNIESIIQDAVTIHLHEKGIINHPEIEVVQMRVALESSVDAIEGENLVQFEALKEQKEKGLLDKSLEYMIKNGMQFEDTEKHFLDQGLDESLVTQDPLKYAINLNIKLNGMHPAEYAMINNLRIDGKDPLEYAMDKDLDFDGTTPKQAALEHVIEKYLATNDPVTRGNLEARYEEIHQMGVEGEVELLRLDSNLGKFVSDDKNMSLMSEVGRDSGAVEIFLKDKELATKCDLALIEKCTQFVEKESQMKPRNYDKLSTMQKVGVAVSMIIPPLAGAVYHVMKKSNKKKKEALQENLNVSLSEVFNDLDKVSKAKPEEQVAAAKNKPQSPQEIAQSMRDQLALGSQNPVNKREQPTPAAYIKPSEQRNRDF